MTTPIAPEILAEWPDWTESERTTWRVRVNSLEARGLGRAAAERMAYEELAGQGERWMMSCREPLSPRDN